MPLRLRKILAFNPSDPAAEPSQASPAASPTGALSVPVRLTPSPPSPRDSHPKAPRAPRSFGKREAGELDDIAAEPAPASPPSDEDVAMEEAEPNSTEFFLGQLWEAVATKNVMTKDTYCRLHAALFRALRTTFNADEASATADKDWTADASGKDHLDRKAFCGSMSSLAQKCVHPATDGRSVAEFLGALVEAVTGVDSSGRRPVRFLRDWPDVPLGAVLGAVIRIRSAAITPMPPPRAQSPGRQRSGSTGEAGEGEAALEDHVMLSQRRARRSWQGGSSSSIALRRFAAANAALRKASGRSLSPSVGRERPNTFAREAASFSAEC
eukprot:tig00000743_g3881.t1